MGYRKISNLTFEHPILLFKEVFASEKIHGTSSHITFKRNETDNKWSVFIFAGGIKHDNFLFMLNTKYRLSTDVLAKFSELFLEKTDVKEVIIYGEGYGGACQKMHDVYGDLNFVAFEVLEDDHWYNITRAHALVTKIGLDFVHFERGPATIEWLNSQRDKPSEQSKKNKISENGESEGIVVRPVIEVYDEKGGRFIAKYRKDKFRETASVRKLTEEDAKVFEIANEIAEEWATDMRLTHVLSALAASGHKNLSIENTSLVLSKMVEDISLECGSEIQWSREAIKAIKGKTSTMFKKRLNAGTTNPIEQE